VKKIVSLMLLSFCSISMVLSGCQSQKSGDQNQSTPAAVVTSQSTPAETPQPSTTILKNGIASPKNIDANAKLLSSTYYGNTEAWLIYSLNNQTGLMVNHSSDSGTSWYQTKLPTEQQWEKEISSQNIFSFFNPSQENTPSWVLLTSEPAAGQMGKELYQTIDKGKSWMSLGNISQLIDGYVTGIAFRNSTDGWISASYHGKTLLPLYRTTNGGKTWTLQKIAIPKGYKYGNTFPPIFTAADKMNGTIRIDFVSDSNTETFQYKTINGGKTWTISSK
jgi:hypothetical protein